MQRCTKRSQGIHKIKKRKKIAAAINSIVSMKTNRKTTKSRKEKCQEYFKGQVDLRVIAVKKYSPLPRSPQLEPHHKI